MKLQTPIMRIGANTITNAISNCVKFGFIANNILMMKNGSGTNATP